MKIPLRHQRQVSYLSFVISKFAYYNNKIIFINLDHRLTVMINEIFLNTINFQVDQSNQLIKYPRSE